MPLIFMVSGAAIFFALRPGKALRFLQDKVWRLLVPLALGILVLGPPQMYLTQLTHGQYQVSFLEYLAVYFRDWRLWNGEFQWTGIHLWYLAYLFLFTLILLPLFAALKSRTGQRVTGFIARLSSRPGVIFLWVLPGVLLIILGDPYGLMGPAPNEGISRLFLFPFVIYGFLVFSDLRIQQAIIRQRWIALGSMGRHSVSLADQRPSLPNPNTGEPLNQNRRWRVADNSVYHDAQRPSRIILPIIPSRTPS